MEFHPIANIFPLMGDVDQHELMADIRDHGMREPVTIYEEMVLDGRNRVLACRSLGISPPTRPFAGSRLGALAFVWSQNFHRRHLNPSQAAVAEGKRKKLSQEYAAEVEKMREEAQEKKREGGKEGGRLAGRGRPKADRDAEQIPQAYDNTLAMMAMEELKRATMGEKRGWIGTGH